MHSYTVGEFFTLKMKQQVNHVTLISSIILTLVISLYLFTPLLDQWVIEKSLSRYCQTLKEEFSGETFSPAYLCTFIEGIE